MTSASSFEISAACSADLPRINDFAGQVNAADWLDPPEQAGQSAGNCLVARVDGTTVGVVQGRWLAPRVGSIVGPFLASGYPPAGPLLLDAILAWFGSEKAKIVTALRPTDDAFHGELRKTGFSSVARISFMVATRLAPPAPTSMTALVVPAEGAENRQRWATALDGSFERTLDCPALRKSMTADDAIETFRHSSYKEQQWLIATHEGTDVGCLILGFDDDEEAVEVLYLGVDASFRGRGFGRQLLNIAFSAARQRKSRRVGLAVDAANQPAVNLYQQGGFYEYDQRDLFSKEL